MAAVLCATVWLWPRLPFECTVCAGPFEARQWAAEAEWPLDSLEVRDATGRPVAGAAVTLGGALVLETDRLGRIRFARSEPGAMMAQVDGPRVRARSLLLDSLRSITLTGPAGR